MGPQQPIFIHSHTPENYLIVESFCSFCHLGIGASSKPELLRLLERVHHCHKKIDAGMLMAVRILRNFSDRTCWISKKS